MLFPEQLELRSHYIGASEVAVLFGCDLYGRQLADLWLAKAGRLLPDVGTADMERGLDMEPPLIDWAVAQLRREGLVSGEPERGIMTILDDNLAANTDAQGFAPDGAIFTLEAKTCRSMDGFGEDWTDEIPLAFKLQVHAQAACIGTANHPCRFGYLVAMLPFYDRRLYCIPIDTEVCASIAKAAAIFMESVRSGRMPEAFTPPSIDTLKLVKRDGERLAPPGSDLLLDTFLALDKRRLDVEYTANKLTEPFADAAEKAKAALIQAMGSAESMRFADGRVAEFKMRHRKASEASDYRQLAVVDRTGKSLKPRGKLLTRTEKLP